MAKADTDDTPLEQALEPDWREGISLEVHWSSSVNRSWSGRDQRQRKWEEPQLKMTYRRSGLTATQARARILSLRTEARQPIKCPWWPDGVPLQSNMPSVTAASLDQNPVHNWDGIDLVWIWDRDNGGEFRDLTLVSGRDLTFSGTGTQYNAGAIVFPCRLCVRQLSDRQVEPINIATGTEQVSYKTL